MHVNMRLISVQSDVQRVSGYPEQEELIIIGISDVEIRSFLWNEGCPFSVAGYAVIGQGGFSALHYCQKSLTSWNRAGRSCTSPGDHKRTRLSRCDGRYRAASHIASLQSELLSFAKS